jgi:hypothetical protein
MWNSKVVFLCQVVLQISNAKFFFVINQYAWYDCTVQIKDFKVF